MSTRDIVVVGAALGGLRTVEALRRRAVDARITLLGAEARLPYDRPPLSKDFLLGRVGASAVELASADRLAALDVDVRLGTPALSLDLDRRVIRVDDGDLHFDDLVIATGASARRPRGLAELGGVHLLRTLDDAAAIRAELPAAPRVVVIGGGFIGAEVASSARALGLSVTVVDVLPVLMHRALGSVIGQRMTDLAVAAGVDLRLGASVTGLVGTGTVEGVQLGDGTMIPADLVVIGVGAGPNTAWLADSGLTLDDGVVCDAHLQAASGVYAVGDVARWQHPIYERLIRCENWSAAGEHAEVVAANLAGTPTVAEAIPYIWSDQHGIKLQGAGVLDDGDDVRFVVDEAPKFVALAGSGERQSSAFAIGAPGPLIRQRIKLAQRPPWPPETA